MSDEREWLVRDMRFLELQIAGWKAINNQCENECDALRSELAALKAQRDELAEALGDMVSDHACLSAPTLAFARAALAKAGA